MALIFLLLSLVLITTGESHAQAVSIVNMDQSREALVLEAGLTHILKTQGYSIKGPRDDGYVILLHGMSAHSTQGAMIGVVGSAVITKVLQKESASHLLSDHRSVAGKDFVDTFTAVMGSPIIYLAGTTAIGGNPEAVAELLSIYINNVLRGKLFKRPELIRSIEGSIDPTLR